MKNRKRGLALFLTLILTLVMIFPLAGVSAESAPVPTVFAALGDSTGFGLSAYVPPFRDPFNVNGFNDQFASSLGLVKNVNYFNFAVPGDRTEELLDKLGWPLIQGVITQSTIMTVTIGGNNLLGPTINSICALWDVTPISGDLNGTLMLRALANAVALKFATIPGYNPMMDFMRLVNPADPIAQQYRIALNAGVSDFKEEWPEIVGQIRALNPHAELYVNTVHNPLRVTGEDDPLYPLYVEMETYFQQINICIKKLANDFRYRVVDINKSFRQHPESLSFDIIGAMQTASYLYADPANASLLLTFFAQTDPHPTMAGHVIAFQQLTKIRRLTPKTFWTCE